MYGLESKMVAIVRSISTAPKRQPQTGRSDSIARLKLLHAEAEETARLANLLGRSAYAGVALPFLAILTMGLAVDPTPAPQMVWVLFVGAVALAMLIAYRSAMRCPFERNALKTYAKDLSAILLFAGFAWGAGAFLALPAATTIPAALVFAILPSAIVASLLRDREALYLFLAPVTALTAAACLLKPLAGGVWGALAILACTIGLAGAAHLYDRLTGASSRPAMLSLP